MKSYIDGALRDLGPEFSEFFDRGRTAIVSIDLHRGHLEDDPLCPCPAPRARDVVAPVDAFHAQARRLGVPVIHVRSTLRAGGIDDVAGRKAAWRLVFPLHVGAIGNADAHAIEGTRWTEFVTEVEADDLVVSGKKRLSAFYPTDLDFLLRNMGVGTLVLNGCLADCCVLNTAFDASNLGYRVVVARDLVAGTNPYLEEAALRIVAMHLGLVTDGAEMLEAWRS
ncbi:cysteine hydrolase family protein [Methylobacterium dankookense]|uniref:N-carbamoylsarcosine amidase n=1 Tax=Methylobacterium dankookense TaxID=560405 RepID=A0A564G1C9_9HYPH|nr:isochorismatase family cysteine hydrolase [Methylobacterium dankookense]GJD54762.1 Peroxyureidoacrylate/ureidoacrylate amidohydrolase RutB [Methylobacterium dankookense]VUF14235.1 N-carbamoylsarcosine amidase [Methylobacterium dankookense]